jgi:hypothetical protein
MKHFGRRRVTTGVAIPLLAAALTLSALALAPMSSSATGTTSSARIGRVHFHDAMRRLWEEHVEWTRMFLISFAAGLPDLKPTEERLLANQVDIGDAVKPFYGRAKGNHLTDLLTRHIVTAARLLKAAKAGNQAKFKDAKADWYRNARHIARFLHRLNPKNWPLAAVRRMMRMHLDLTLQEASDRLAGKFRADIRDYQAVETEILKMADVLSKGIEAQFPGRFR